MNKIEAEDFRVDIGADRVSLDRTENRRNHSISAFFSKKKKQITTVTRNCASQLKILIFSEFKKNYSQKIYEPSSIQKNVKIFLKYSENMNMKF